MNSYKTPGGPPLLVIYQYQIECGDKGLILLDGNSDATAKGSPGITGDDANRADREQGEVAL